MPSTYKRGMLCKDVTWSNIKITWEHIWDSYPVCIQTYLYAQIKFKNYKQTIKELPETGWRKKISIHIFMALSLQNTTTVAESWNREKLKNISYYPKNSEPPVTQKAFIEQAWIYWNLNKGFSMKALTWHQCNKPSYLTNQYRGFDFNKGDKSYSNPGQLQALNRWWSLGLHRGPTYRGCTNVSY